MAGHPEVIGLRWDDHGFARTLTCRAHAEATRHAYRDAPPDENNALVYPGEPFVCDFCHEGAEAE